MVDDGTAAVTPQQGWANDGYAVVAPIPPFPEPDPRVLRFDNRQAGTHTVRRSEYPGGLAIVVTGHEPSSQSATFPVWTSSEDEVLVTGDKYVNWPDGFVIWFLTQ